MAGANVSGSSADPNVLDLYKLSVEMADRTSARRLTTNAFFVTINSALIAFTGILTTTNSSGAKQLDKFSLITVAVAGIIASFAWWALLRYYRRLNTAKFAVINAIESQLPVQPFSDEWEVLHPNSSPGAASAVKWYQLIKKFKNNKHREATVVEQTVPLLFAALNVAVIVRVVIL